MATVEKTVRMATVVDTLHEAFTFVMDHLDSMGKSPSVIIEPIEEDVAILGGEEWVTRFEVAVEGMEEIDG